MNSIVQFLIEFWETLAEMSPFLLFGFFIAGVLSLYITPKTVEKYLGKKGIISVIKASILGIPLPLCSCSVIPVATSLKRGGATNGATTSFMISTPQTGIDSIFVTYSLLGPIFTIFRPIVALISGIIGGILVDIFVDKIKKIDEVSCNNCNDNCKPLNTKDKFAKILHYGFIVLLNDIGTPLLIGLIIAGVISVLIPDNFLSEIVGTGIQSMLIMLFFGIPTYVCATASVPIAAVLIAKGVPPGAVFVFLVAGPASNAATVATMWKLIGKSATFIYLATIAITALSFGSLLDFIFKISTKTTYIAMGYMMPDFINNLSAVILLSLILFNLFNSNHKKDIRLHKDKNAFKIIIEGMTCGNCVETIRKELLNDPAIDHIEVDLGEKTVLIYGNNLNANNIMAKISNLGYNAKKFI